MSPPLIPPLIRGLDHVAIAVRDFDAAVDGYRRLLGREPELEPRDGANRAWFHLGNMALEVIAPSGEGAAGDRVNARLDFAGEGLWIAAFQVDDVAAAGRLLSRRGLDVEPYAQVARVKAAGLDFVLTPGRIGAAPSPAIGPEDASVPALDHIVVHTPNPDRALGLYGAKFGLDLRLDRANERWGARQLFFRCGGAVFEVGASLKGPVTDEADRFGGLAWRVSDPDAAQARIAAAGFDVSEVRPGRKPGTKVFTVRDAPGGAPTLMLMPSPELETA
ncbi:VOC family protein [Phenylobacterium sp.]|uniref:VOC family protein n=1 Tax=Phenylobacterium sp. TaxID=1871053 RepID=UPI002B98C3D9|nr:VOC family protein [Phenylobacterium sp.]HLZ76326.1 VOC family protein [Phenylobacterium sp.]